MGKLRMGPLTMAGALTEAEVRMPMMNRHPDIMACYSRGLARNPNLIGRVTLRLEIGKRGAVMIAGNGGSDLPDREVVDCAIRASSKATFPAKGGATTLLYPMMMEQLSQK
jgi:hypothetical protein